VQADLTPIFRSVPTNNRTVSRKNMIAHFDSWTARAHAVPIECETERRGIELRGAVERVGPCPKCGGEDRFAIHTKKGVWNCRGCGVGGDVIKLVEHLDGINFIAACTALTGEPPPKADCGGSTCEPRKIAAAEFRYEDENGAMRLVVERIEFQNADGTYVLTKDGKRKKTFRQKRLDPDRVGRWLWNADGVPTLPYRLPELIEAIAAGLVILIVEGECKVDLLRSWNIPATCCAGGAKKWRFEHSAFLRGANAVILPDNDDAGRAHMNVVAASLQGAAATIRVLELPGLPPKGDIVDWAAAGGTAELLHRLIDGASHWRPAISSMGVADIANESAAKVMDEVDEDAVFERLAKLPPGVKLAREIKSAAKRLGISQDAINDELEARRDEKANAPLHDHWIVEPWPEPIDSDSLLRDIMLRIRRHVVCSHDDALAISLWIMFAWVHDAVATHSPILNINSAEPESGKSTTLGLISFLVPRCVSSVEISEAAVYRAIELWQPCFAIDEFDSVLASEDKSALRSIINSGHTRGQGVVRCVEPDLTPRLFKTFCPKAIGMVGRKLPATTLGRCIMVELRRRKSSEPIKRFAHKDDAELAELRSRLARWAVDNEQALRSANTPMPEAFDNRRADNWRVLLAVADLAGEDWADKARLAAGKLEGASDISSIGVRLLTDIKRTFEEDGRDCILSALLVDKLKEDPEGPWAEWGRGKGLTQNSLAVLLGGGGGRGRGSRGGFGIRSQDVHPSSGVHGKGYKRSQFEDAWARYLSVQSPCFPPEGGE
jgi:Protein of unknown function (DUF3631)/Zinc-binding domain of primase-helicase